MKWVLQGEMWNAECSDTIPCCIEENNCFLDRIHVKLVKNSFGDPLGICDYAPVLDDLEAIEWIVFGYENIVHVDEGSRKWCPQSVLLESVHSYHLFDNQTTVQKSTIFTLYKQYFCLVSQSAILLHLLRCIRHYSHSNLCVALFSKTINSETFCRFTLVLE